jgi:hypothetical protein
MKSTHTQSRNMEGMAKPGLRHLHNVVAVLAVLAGLAVFGGPAAATAQNAAESKAQLNGCHPQGPEGSWLYTVTIPGYTFQGIETYSAGGGYMNRERFAKHAPQIAFLD